MLVISKDSANTQPIAKAESFTGDGSTTVFNFTYLIGTDVTKVYFFYDQRPDGDLIDSSSYTLDGSSITFNAAPGIASQSYTATGGETTLQLAKTPFGSITSITKNSTTLAESTDYTVDSNGLITFTTALSANDDIEVSYIYKPMIVCETDGASIWDEYAVLPNSPNADDRTITQELYVVETSQSAYNSVSIDLVDYVSGSGASSSWVTLSLDGTTYQSPPLGLGSIPLGGNKAFWAKVVVPQQTINFDLRDIAFELRGLAVNS